MRGKTTATRPWLQVFLVSWQGQRPSRRSLGEGGPRRLDRFTEPSVQKERGRTLLRPLMRTTSNPFITFDAAPQFNALLHTRSPAFLHRNDVLTIPDSLSPACHHYWLHGLNFCNILHFSNMQQFSRRFHERNWLIWDNLVPCSYPF
jgi:hypothetical protein